MRCMRKNGNLFVTNSLNSLTTNSSSCISLHDDDNKNYHKSDEFLNQLQKFRKELNNFGSPQKNSTLFSLNHYPNNKNIITENCLEIPQKRISSISKYRLDNNRRITLSTEDIIEAIKKDNQNTKENDGIPPLPKTRPPFRTILLNDDNHDNDYENILVDTSNSCCSFTQSELNLNSYANEENNEPSSSLLKKPFVPMFTSRSTDDLLLRDIDGIEKTKRNLKSKFRHHRSQSQENLLKNRNFSSFVPKKFNQISKKPFPLPRLIINDDNRGDITTPPTNVVLDDNAVSIKNNELLKNDSKEVTKTEDIKPKIQPKTVIYVLDKNKNEFVLENQNLKPKNGGDDIDADENKVELRNKTKIEQNFPTPKIRSIEKPIYANFQEIIKMRNEQQQQQQISTNNSKMNNSSSNSGDGYAGKRPFSLDLSDKTIPEFKEKEFKSSLNVKRISTEKFGGSIFDKNKKDSSNIKKKIIEIAEKKRKFSYFLFLV